MTGNLNMGNNEIKNLKDPVNDQDAATKKWINTSINTKGDVDRDNLTLNGISAVETIHNVSTKVFDNYSRLIVQFSKYQNIDPNHLYVDITIKLKVGKLYPMKLQTYMVCYGVKGLQTDVPSSVYDAIWGIDNGKITFNEMIDMNNKDIIGVIKITTANLDVNGQIDMNNKDITGVNKITTADLDVNSQIDMKSNKIIRVGDGTSNNDAVNKIQLDVEVSIVNKIILIRNDINTILNSLNKLKYYFTDQLKHNNADTVKFPAINSYPLSADNNSEFLKITLDGHYQIIYTDSFMRDAQFIIHDDTNGNDLFVIHLDGNSFWTPITINTVIPITVDNGFNYARIKMYLKKKTSNEPKFDGINYGTFHIKYLHT